MAKVVFISSKGKEHEIEVLPGLSIMEAAVQNGVDEIEGQCGGSSICATCRVQMDELWFNKLTPAELAEIELLTGMETAQGNFRLSCQINISEDLDGMVLHTLPES